MPKPPVRYVWHHELHSQSGETLWFVRLFFEPVFPNVVQQLSERLEKLGVLSAHVYELIGAHDLVMRVWLPNTLDVRTFIEDLDLRDLRRADYMRVTRVREHWVLDDDPRTANVPRVEDIDPSIIAAANEAISEQDTSGSDAVDKCVGEGWLAPVHDSSAALDARSGVKFFISIVGSVGNSPSINFEDILFERVRTVLDEAKDLVDKRSIYGGDGFARLLLMGRFDPCNYFDFIQRVVVRLNDEEMRAMFFARTFTALGSRPEPVIAIEHLQGPVLRTQPKREPREQIDLVRLLEQGEGQYVEVKASAFLNLDRLVNKQEPDWSEIRPELVKAVCGLLNQLEPRTATLIVGAVETKKFRQWLEETGRRYAVGDFTILGVEEDNPSGDWDKYQRRLTDCLASAIEPSPVPFMTASLEELEHEGTSSLLLRLELTPTDKPFYTNDGDELWVRTGPSAKSLTARARDEFVGQMRTRAQSDERRL